MILTGAGISAESGLGTFRDKGGLWTQYDLAEVATPEGFARDPVKVHDFYNARRANCLQAAPNAAHDALAQLEDRMGDEMVIVTQNVDDLHERAGSTRVLHMHGTLMGALCADCSFRWVAPPVMQVDDLCPKCGAPRTRPDVVWFGEYPYAMNYIADVLAGAATFVAIGTSGQVYPAAGFANDAYLAGAETIEINLEPTGADYAFSRQIQGPATVTVPAWVKEILDQSAP